ncbi:MAG: alpha/beta fold hydrolase [Bdellovibrionales bacterium]
MTAPLPGKLPDANYGFHACGDGARLRYAVAGPESSPRGTILVLPGRREFIEKKHFEFGEELTRRDFQVIYMEWRGQGLSTRALDGRRRQRDHTMDFGVLLADLTDFYRNVVKPRQAGPFIVAGHSMGGLLATLWLAEHAEETGAKALILTAPAFAIGVPRGTNLISRALALMGAEWYAPGMHDYNDIDRKLNVRLLSHDAERNAIIEKYFDGVPDMAVGGVTWGWLAAVFRMLARIRQPDFLERIALPVLAICGGKDIVTPSAKSIALLRRMPNVEIVTIPGALHDIMNEADNYRSEAWRAIDGFLRRFTTA